MMRKLFMALFFCLFFALFPVCVSAAEAPVLNSAATAVSGELNLNRIFDENRSTKLELSGNNTIVIETSEPFYSLYFVWDEYPSNWRLKTPQGETAAEYSALRYLHEYVSFGTEAEPQSYTNLRLEVTDGVLCDVYLLGEGESPSFVQKWQPSYNDADMLVMPTHADDEHLYFGGTLPFYSENKKVQVIYFTNHNGEKYRNHELLDGLWTVGITAYPVIYGFQDAYADTIEQAKALYPEEEAMQFVVTMLRRFLPEVVIMHDFNGEYGHGVHKYNAYIMAKALEAAADPAQFPMGQYASSHDVEKAYFHLYPEREIIMDWSAPLERFGGKSSLEMAKAGYDAHKSQHQWSFAVEDFGAYDCRKFGLYRTTVGDDVLKNDFFENITPEMYSDYIAPEPEPVSLPDSVLSEPEEVSSVQSVPENSKKSGIPIAAVIIIVFILAIAATALIIIKNKR